MLQLQKPRRRRLSAGGVCLLFVFLHAGSSGGFLAYAPAKSLAMPGMMVFWKAETVMTRTKM